MSEGQPSSTAAEEQASVQPTVVVVFNNNLGTKQDRAGQDRTGHDRTGQDRT